MGTLASELAPHVGRLVPQPRIYADANVPAGVIAYMRDRLGWDVLAVVEDDELRRASDLEHCHTARRLHRTLITLDDDFVDAQRFPASINPGIVVLSAPDEARVVRLLKKVASKYFGARSRRASGGSGLPLIGRTIHVHPDWNPARPGRRRRRSGPGPRLT